MFKLTCVILIAAFISSCQSTPKRTWVPEGRNLASGQTFVRFIERLSIRTKIPKHQIEKSIISFIQDPVPNSTFGNHVALGLTDDQARKIRSLR